MCFCLLRTCEKDRAKEKEVEVVTIAGNKHCERRYEVNVQRHRVNSNASEIHDTVGFYKNKKRKWSTIEVKSNAEF